MLIGILGKPNVGKSTFFKSCTLADVGVGNRPFVTLLPNRGVGYVKVDCIDKEFGVKCQPAHGFCINSQRFVPVELMDVAGLVPGASEGKGLGNQFLDNLRQADVFVHIVDASGKTDEKGKQTEKYDITKDIVFLEKELDKWYYNIFLKAWKTFSRKAEVEKGDFAEKIAKQFSGLKVTKEQVKEVLLELNFEDKPSSWTNKQVMEFTSKLRKKTKPMIIAANKIDTSQGKSNYEKLKDKFPNLMIVPCSADSELALREAAKAGLINYIPGEKDFQIIDSAKINERQKQALEKIKENVLDIFDSTGVQQILNKAVFSLLNYIAIFPAGGKLKDSKGRILPDCFLLPQGSTALDFAYFLHTDFGRNFIKAIDARTKRALGKDYELKHRDALEIICR